MISSDFKEINQDNMMGSCPIQPIDNSKIENCEIQNSGKTVTKLPPLRRNKFDESSKNGDKVSENTTFSNLQRKQSQQDDQKKYISNTQIAKKQMKKKTEIKKDRISTFKPQVVQRYNNFREFLNHINITNNLKVIPAENFNKYTLFIGKGNNSSLIETIFKNYRPWWNIEQHCEQNKKINLYWYQLRQNNVLDKMKDMAKVQNETQIPQYYLQQKQEVLNETAQIQSQKSGKKVQIRSQSLIYNESKTSTRFNINKRAASKSKISNSIQKTSPSAKQIGPELKEEMESQIMQNGKEKKQLINPKMWSIYHIYRRIFSPSQLKQLKNLKAIHEDGKISQRLSKNKLRVMDGRSEYVYMHNHCQNNWNLSNKKALFYNMKSYYQAKKINPFQYIPMTFHVENIQDKQFQRFVEIFHKRNEEINQQEKQNRKNQKNQNQFKVAFKAKRRNAWLVKPGENTNRGTGIQVVQTIQEIKEIILREKTDQQGRPRTHIIQDYIMPFLYQKRKFDIRSYICITSVNGCFKGYWFQDGYIRTASKEFNMKNLANKFIHLTNDAVQKKSEDYGRFEPGNKLSYSDFQRYLDATVNANSQGHKLKFGIQVYPEMKKLATDAIRAVYSKIDPNKKQFSFQIFGLDFLIDENFKVWLIEANTNPCLQLSSPLLARLIPNMVENAFRIAVDPIFPPPSLSNLAALGKKIPLPENILEGNKFELVFDQMQQGKELKSIMTNTPQIKIYNIEEEQEEYEDQVCKEIKIENNYNLSKENEQ